MRKLLLLFFVLITSIQIANAASSPYSNKVYDVETADGHLIKAYLSYPKTKLPTYDTVVMLHSLGYSAYYWNPLKERFNDAGYAVLTVDLRGHGKSVYDVNFRKKSWTLYKKDAFKKYPDDILSVIDYVKSKTKKANFNNYAIIGADIGANTAVLVAQKMKVKPKSLVLISPSMDFKGIYIPVALTEIGDTPILAIASKNDKISMAEQAKLKKFAQADFEIYNTQHGSLGMITLKQNPSLNNVIFNWVNVRFAFSQDYQSGSARRKAPIVIDASKL